MKTKLFVHYQSLINIYVNIFFMFIRTRKRMLRKISGKYQKDSVDYEVPERALLDMKRPK